MKNKKVISLIMTAMLLTSLVGCNSSNVTVEENSNISSSVVNSDLNDHKSELTVSSDEDFSVDIIDDDGTMEVQAYDSTANIVNVPAEIEGVSVTRISGEILRGDTTVIEVNIPDTVTYITSNAFQFCTSLEKITFGKNVEEIGETLCMGNTALKEVVLPEKLKKISAGTFIDCTSLEKINIPDSVTELDYTVFGNCTSLKEIHMTDSVTFIADENKESKSTFYRCDNLTIYAPAGSYAEEYAKKKNIPFVAE